MYAREEVGASRLEMGTYFLAVIILVVESGRHPCSRFASAEDYFVSSRPKPAAATRRQVPTSRRTEYPGERKT